VRAAEAILPPDATWHEAMRAELTARW
jgi:hypothetical protein